MPRIRGVRKGYSRLLRDYGFVRILQPEIEERNQRAGTKQRQGHEGQAGDGKHYIKDELHGHHMLCGAEGYLIRTNPLIGMNPYVLAAGIGGCLLALLDVCTTE